MLVGVGCLIIGLAIYEKFGWAGGIIMGPIETSACWPTPVLLRVMGVGVAGVKMLKSPSTWDGTSCCPVAALPPLYWSRALPLHPGLALALGILSPNIHAARLHFVEWMGKFPSGTGRVFTPIGGRTLHTEGQS